MKEELGRARNHILCRRQKIKTFFRYRIIYALTLLFRINLLLRPQWCLSLKQNIIKQEWVLGFLKIPNNSKKKTWSLFTSITCALSAVSNRFLLTLWKSIWFLQTSYRLYLTLDTDSDQASVINFYVNHNYYENVCAVFFIFWFFTFMYLCQRLQQKRFINRGLALLPLTLSSSEIM